MIVRVEFQEVPEAFATEQEATLARAVCKIVSRDLGLGEVAIRWVQPCHESGYYGERKDRFWGDDSLGGFVRNKTPGAIYLVTGWKMPRLVEIVAHELRHLWQAERHGDWASWWRDCDRDYQRADQEADATEYGRKVRRDLGF